MFRSARYSKANSKSKGIRKEVYAYKKRIKIISIIVTFVIVFFLVALALYYFTTHFTPLNYPTNEDGSNSNDSPPKAALIDALYTTFPNKNFTRSINETLCAAGFKVDVFQGNDVTVEFLKKLPIGYKLIILRMHSALAANNQLYLFTAEPCDNERLLRNT